VKLIPALKQTLYSLEHISWGWVVGLIALELVSELGFVLAWGRSSTPRRCSAVGRGVDDGR